MTATRYVIFCMGRTGSTLLADLLASHPDIESRGEFFSPSNAFVAHAEAGPAAFLDGPAYLTDRPIQGFKMPWDWIEKYLDVPRLLAERGYRVILLRRRSVLDQYLSGKLGVLNHAWNSAAVYPAQRVRLDPVEFLQFTAIHWQTNRLLERFAGPMPQFHVAYEDLFDPEAQAGVLAFLGAEVRPLVSASTIRGRTLAVDEVIENYDEVSRFFAATGYAALFPPRR